MAAPTCTFCGQYQAVYMGTSISDGETVCPCGNCLPGMMLGMAAALIGSMSADELAASQDALETICTAYGRPAPSKPSRKRSAPSEPTSADQAAAPNGAMAGDQPLIDECPNCGEMVEVTAGGEFNCPTCTPLHVTNSADQ